MGRDAIAELRDRDPARRVRLDAVDPGALVALREGITMTERGTTEPRTERAVGRARQGARRLGRRGALVGGLAVVLAGGGVAFAASQIWSDEEGAATSTMATECREVFELGYPNEGATVARAITGDPVADCQAVRAAEGLDPISDPVAFILDGTGYVTPADQVPPGAELLDVDPAVAAIFRELQASLADVVDGGWARCLSAEDAQTWAESEFRRLGLSDWSVEIVHGADMEGDYPCSVLSVGERPHTVQVFPEMDPPVDEVLPGDVLAELRNVGESCLTVDAAIDVATSALGSLESDGHMLEPVNRVVDAGATCARLDLEVSGGGSTLLSVYGPEAG